MYLLNGTSSKCVKCSQKRKHIDGIPHGYWKNVINRCIKRNMELKITPEECYDLLKKQNFKCALSGMNICMAKNATEQLEGKTSASLDRIDSTKPYISSNIQWLHKDVNFMKHTFDEDYFVTVCEKIVTTKNAL